MTPLFKAIHDDYKLFTMNLVISLCRKKHTKMKVDLINKIIFSKLGEHGAYCKVESIHLQDKRFRRVCTNQKWVVMKESFKD